VTSLIEHFYEETDFILQPTPKINDWIIHTVEQENKELVHINYIFCSDEYLHKINVEYLNHDYYTDIITFDNSEKSEKIEGDIYISVDRVKENSDENGIPFIDEVRRVMIHGVLHLVGFHDKTDSEQLLMREKENAYLSLPAYKI